MGGRGRGGGFGAEHVVAGAPYSAVEVRTFQEQLGDGNVINRTSQTTLYRDSQGRTRTERTITPSAASGKQAYTMISISDPVAGQRHELNSSTMTSHTSKIRTISSTGSSQARTAAPPAGRTGRGGAAVAKTDLGSQVKNGVLATGTRQTEVIPAGKIGNSQPMTVVRETWYSAQVKRAVEVKITDPQRGNSTTELTNLIAGEPSAALFTVPSSYTETAGGRGGRGAFRGARQ
jgi:hypothetical protein